MVGLRKGHCYRIIKRAYTRQSKFKPKAYVKGVPAIKIQRFDLGDMQKNFGWKVHLITKGALQLRHNAVESARQVVSRILALRLGNNYHLKVKPYPHHVLRENRMLTGAGADRMSTGMQLSFGRPVGSAAQVKKGQQIFTVYVDKEGVEHAKEALSKAHHRMPGKYVIEIVKENKMSGK